MRYEIEFAPDDENCIGINVDVPLLKRGFINLDPTDDSETAREVITERAANPEGLLAFYSLVTGLPGMRHELVFDPYCIVLNKAKLFSWDDLRPVILYLLATCVAPDGVIEEVKPAPAPAPAKKERPGKKRGESVPKR